MRKALVVGINHYKHSNSLFGCVNDARAVHEVLARNSDGSVNFDVKFLSAEGSKQAISRRTLKHEIQELFKGDSETAIFYFAGHGHIEATGGYLLATDSESGDGGVPLRDVVTFANESGARNKIIILDSCHSGVAGNGTEASETAKLCEGITILTASTAEQYATEKNGSGVFTGLFVDAMKGAAANLVGAVTPGSVYAHIDQSLGPWDQRPVFKTNVKSFVSLREVDPPVSLQELRRITEFFPSPGVEFPLDPSFEPERGQQAPITPSPDPVNTAKFAILQKYSRVNLVVPVAAPHMWHAAIESKACKLTTLGEHYRRLVEDDRI